MLLKDSCVLMPDRDNSNPCSQNIECDVIDIFPCVQATSGITKATGMAVALFNRLVDMGVLNFARFSDPRLTQSTDGTFSTFIPPTSVLTSRTS